MYDYMQMNMSFSHVIAMLLFWGVIISLLYFLFCKNSSNNEALNILKKRLANGEISKKEFDKLKEAL